MEYNSKHHRKPRSKGGKTIPKNISLVNSTQHKAYHTLFFNYSPQEICEILNETWIDPDYMLICVKIK